MTDETIPVDLDTAANMIVSRMLKVLFAKRRMRGSTNITRQGLAGLVNRIDGDKMSRIRNEIEKDRKRSVFQEYGIPVPRELQTTDEEVESLADDFLDVGNYCIIAMLVMSDWWELPLSPESTT